MKLTGCAIKTHMIQRFFFIRISWIRFLNPSIKALMLRNINDLVVG